MRYLIVLGTRPEIIKMAPLINELKNQGHDPFIVHTGQHYSTNMDEVFWESLSLPRPNLRLGVQESNQAAQVGEMLRRLDVVMTELQPDWVLVHGDTNSTLAGALAAGKRPGTRIAHIEAGLRSFDRSMPEEVNRVIVDQLSHLLFAPTHEAASNLIREGIAEDRIRVVGNTIEDAVTVNLEKVRDEKLNVVRKDSKPYGVLTLHRAENTASEERLAEILLAVFDSSAKFDLDLMFSVHPRTQKLIESMHLDIPAHVRLLEPMGYFEFLSLLDHARIVATDSGGLQEEACLLNKPCVTLRENTERPETILIGCNTLGGIKRDSITDAFELMMKAVGPWASPYGNGLASKRIVETLESLGSTRFTEFEALNPDLTVFGIEPNVAAALKSSRIF